MFRKDCIAMILAGGQGSRLKPLTQVWAKPAVPFGRQHRLIDFPISNCVNSSLNSIGILTQYKADSLHHYVGDGQAWFDSSKLANQLALLPSSRVSDGGYLGTADAIYQNIDYIDQQNPEHVLILSGDHVYQMNYRPLLQYHKQKGAPATILVKEVDWSEASRFGIMNTDSELRITQFEEKPQRPQSNLASLGIYMFEWAVLRQLLIEDAMDPLSSHDFGKDIIPGLLKSELPIYAYPFAGYWRDVGTIESLWESNMDLLNGELRLGEEASPLYSRGVQVPGAADHAAAAASFLPASRIPQKYSLYSFIRHSVVSIGCRVGFGSRVKDSFLMPGVSVGKHARITRAIIGENAVIEEGAVIGGEQEEIVVIPPGEHVRAGQRFNTIFSSISRQHV